jgi:hypothetical protein
VRHEEEGTFSMARGIEVAWSDILMGMRTLTILLASILILTGIAVGAEKASYIKARGGPTGAGLFVDGNYIGPAGRFTVPEKYEVQPGEHEIALKDPRYEDYSTKVSVRPGKTTKIHYKLKKLPEPKGPFGRVRFGGDGEESWLSITAGDTGPVYINERFAGFIDELNNARGGMLIPPGTYTIRAESKKYGVVSRTVTVEANKVTVIPLEKK